jgi:hypothetical protein
MQTIATAIIAIASDPNVLRQKGISVFPFVRGRHPSPNVRADVDNICNEDSNKDATILSAADE